jgi:hypothetical protein
MIQSDFSGKLIDETSKLGSKIYDDLAQPSIKEVGDVLGRSVKLLLSPVRGMCWGFEQIEKVVTEELENRLNKIPEENHKTPDPEIAVPLMQALQYTAQNETLREMYLNLLANAMDSSKDKDVHPSFVELIKQMNSLDAKVFEKLSLTQGYQQVINPQVTITETNRWYGNATPEWFIGWTIPGFSIFDVSASLVRLGKFGIIELMYDQTLVMNDSEELKAHPELIQILTAYRTAYPDKTLDLTFTDSVIYVNEYGQQFRRVCM